MLDPFERADLRRRLEEAFPPSGRTKKRRGAANQVEFAENIVHADEAVDSGSETGEEDNAGLINNNVCL